MPLHVVRGHTPRMVVDAVVHIAMPHLLGGGMDPALSKLAGRDLTKALRAVRRKKCGHTQFVEAPGMECRWMIHVAGPSGVWWRESKETKLRACYRSAMQMAQEHKLETLAFPFVHPSFVGLSREQAARIALDEIEAFVRKNDLTVYLVLSDLDKLHATSSLQQRIVRYIQERYVTPPPPTGLHDAMIDDVAIGLCLRPEDLDEIPDDLPDMTVSSPANGSDVGTWDDPFELLPPDLHSDAPEPTSGGAICASAAADFDGDAFDSDAFFSACESAQNLSCNADDSWLEDSFEFFLRDLKREEAVSPPTDTFCTPCQAAPSVSFDREASWEEDTLEFIPPTMQERASLHAAPAPLAAAGAMPFTEAEHEDQLRALLDRTDESFTQMLLRKIDESGMTDPECYRRANVDRRLFSKIRNNLHYQPSKQTALAFAVALRLNAAETETLLRTAGLALSRSSRFDIVVEYCIAHQIYDIHQINRILFDFDLMLLGA